MSAPPSTVTAPPYPRAGNTMVELFEIWKRNRTGTLIVPPAPTTTPSYILN